MLLLSFTMREPVVSTPRIILACPSTSPTAGSEGGHCASPACSSSRVGKETAPLSAADAGSATSELQEALVASVQQSIDAASPLLRNEAQVIRDQLLSASCAVLHRPQPALKQS